VRVEASIGDDARRVTALPLVAPRGTGVALCERVLSWHDPFVSMTLVRGTTLSTEAWRGQAFFGVMRTGVASCDCCLGGLHTRCVWMSWLLEGGKDCGG
jgi:hypothetical protein